MSTPSIGQGIPIDKIVSSLYGSIQLYGTTVYRTTESIHVSSIEEGASFNLVARTGTNFFFRKVDDTRFYAFLINSDNNEIFYLSLPDTTLTLNQTAHPGAKEQWFIDNASNGSNYIIVNYATVTDTSAGVITAAGTTEGSTVSVQTVANNYPNQAWVFREERNPIPSTSTTNAK